MTATACDACRLRKVKCSWLDDSKSCNFCSSIGISCTTAPRQRQRAKKVARGTASTAPRKLSNSAGANDTSRPVSPSRRHPAVKSASEGARLLGVASLTRQALDSCIDSYFSTIGQVLSLSQPQALFTRRMRVHLYYASGLDIPAELADIAHDPASRLLILAVACRGAFFSPYSALADELYAHCSKILSEPDSATVDYMDAIEAILLLSELTIQPRHATATELDPLGKGTVVDLALYHKLHIAPPPGSPDFQRRLALFTRIWAHDAIRSASAHTCYRITDDDFGWPLPSNAEDVPYVALTLATREICATLLSPRAKGLGITDEVVQQALDTLEGLRSRMRVTIESLNACLAPGATPDNEPLYPFNAGNPLKPMEQLFMLSTHNWLHLVIWVAVQESMERHPGRVSPSTMVNAESAAVAACEDMATLAQISTAHSLHVRGPRSIRNHMAAFALFLVRVFTSIASPTVEQSSRYFALAETLNFGVRSATYYPDSDTLANTLRMALYRATRIGSKDAARVAERGLEGLPEDSNNHNVQMPTSTESVDPLVTSCPPPTQAAAPVPQHPDAVFLQADFTAATASWTNDATIVASPVAQDAAKTCSVPLFSNPVDTFCPPPVSDSSSRSTSVSLDWSELMDTLKGCGFELPLGPL